MATTLLDSGQVIKRSYDENKQAIKISTVGGVLVPEEYDAIALTYYTSGTGSGQIETVTYSLAGNIVATLTLTYNADGNLETVSKS